MAEPKVTVLMSVFNEERYLRISIESILNQTFADFEFVIINDGSDDSTRTILDEYENQDKRIMVIDQEHSGLAKSLNKVITVARGKYIARMDADDIAMPHRLEKQVNYLDTNPAIGILGSNAQMIDLNGKYLRQRLMPSTGLNIIWTILISNPFIHPTIMIRRDILIENNLTYDETYTASQDYDLWTRMLKYTQGANLNEQLIEYRIGQGITNTNREIQLMNHDKISMRTIQEQLPGLKITLEQVSQLRAMFIGGREYAPPFESDRIVLSNIYLNMFKIFMKNHRRDPDLKALKRQKALVVTQHVIRFPLLKGWQAVLGRLIILDWCLIWIIICQLIPSGYDYRKKQLRKYVEYLKHTVL